MFENPVIRPRVTGHGRSHVGLVRTQNEDAYALAPDCGIAAVADGMGDGADGRYVADRVVAAVCGVRQSWRLEETMTRVSEAVHEVDGDVFRRSWREHRRMGATLVAAIVGHNRLGVLWAGASRAYVFRRDGLYCVTHDHTEVQDLVDAGRIHSADAQRHPKRHLLTRAVGATPRLDIAVNTVPLWQGDIVLLTTDGVHGAVGDEQIRACLTRHGARADKYLIDLALTAGGHDNATVVLLQV